ncbi:MAG: thiamine pyrophosphate-binding protein [Proteobacteria bacterium]|nr:thiamine pyrophosphate-binding protein [Pseudomonadota bacterium]
MTEMTGAEALVRCLMAEGVKTVFGIPGDQCGPVTDAIYRLGQDGGVEFITTRHEQAAAHMADAWARVSGEPGVCLATVGPGVADLVPGVYTAWADSIPVVVLGAQNQTWRIYPEHGSMQALDQLALLTPITKWRALVADVRRMPQLTQWAFRVAASGRPGPVYLDLPSNVLCDRVDTEQFPILPPEQYRATIPAVADGAVIEHAADMLVAAEWPLLHAGSGVLRAGAWAELLTLAEYLSAAVTTSQGARGVIPEDHPLCLIPAAFGALGAQATADVVLLVGGRMGDMEFWGKPPGWGPPDQQKWIQIDIAPESIGLNRQVDLALVGDAKATLSALLEAVKKRTGSKSETPRFADAREAQAVWLRQWEEGARSNSTPIHPLRLVREIREFFPREAIVCSDGGTTALWAFYLNRIYEPRTFLWAADSGHLGSGVPYAIGAKLARPEVPVYCITGDGSFGFNAIELETARRAGAPVVIIIANDCGWGMIRSAQKLVHGGRYIGVDFCDDTRYDRFAQALGCYGERVTEPAEIKPALQRAVDSNLPAVLDILVDQEIHGFPPDLEVLDGLWMEGCERE